LPPTVLEEQFADLHLKTERLTQLKEALASTSWDLDIATARLDGLLASVRSVRDELSELRSVLG
jgi:hypothetical protein